MTPQQIIDAFSGKTIAVIGDIMLDKYIWGAVTRISPEAPVQVVEAQKETFSPGAAANVARNVKSLGATALLLGITGKDEGRTLILDGLTPDNIDVQGVLTDNDRPTCQKVRIMGRGQQLLRVDYEDKAHVHTELEKQFINHLDKIASTIDGIIVSDYAKGVITPSIMKHILTLAKQHDFLVVVDPKPEHSSWYTGSTLITPNNTEACAMVGQTTDNSDQVVNIGKSLSDALDTNVLLTRGEKGMTLIDKKKTTIHIETQAKEVYDVTGAGDTVIATATLCLATGASFKDAAILANHAAGIKVGKVGTAAVSAEELLAEVRGL